jgi:site-specific recombinase XerD
MLKKEITGFIAYCKVAGFASKSIESLSAGLRELNAFLEEQPVTAVQDITYSQLSAFVADFKQPSIHKKKARVWCLRQFFHYLCLTGLVGENIATGLPYPKIEKTVPNYLTSQEYNSIIEYFSSKADTPNGLRNLIMILMLGLLGLRTGTIVSLNIEHIDLEAGLARIREKGRHKRQIVLPGLITRLLNNYFAQLSQTTGPLFLSVRKKRISPRILQDIFRSAADNLDIDKRLHAHLFRHTAATHLNRVAGTTITQEVLGHARRQSTLRYAHLNPDQYAVYMNRHPFMQKNQP